MKILVTGGAGFIGSHVVDLLIENKHDVIIIDNLVTGLKENLNQKARFYKEDLSNHSKIQEIFEKEKPEVIYHLAAQIDLRKAIENPVWDAQINIIHTINILELSVKYKIRHFIFSSSGGAIFGEEHLPSKEGEFENPLTPYGCAKLAIEKYLHSYNIVYGLHYTVLRYSNVYGPRQNSKGEGGVIATFFGKMLKNENPTINGGNQTRDFVFVEDVAKANLLALEDNKSEIYNISAGTEINMRELFGKMNILFADKFKAQYKEYRKGDQMKSCLSYGKIKSALGWQPSLNLDEGLKKTLDCYKNNGK